MRIRVLKAFGDHRVGDVLPEVPGNQARAWIDRGLVAEEPPAPGRGGYLDRMMRGRGRKPA